MDRVDFAIIGSGISGCYSAILLSEKGYRVNLISTQIRTSFHLPETWVYSPTQLMREMNLLGDLEKCFMKNTGILFSSSDGKRKIHITVSDEEDFISEGKIYKIDRNHFDQALLSKAEEKGVKCIQIDCLNDISLLEEEVRLFYTKDKTEYSFAADYLIDASGKSSFLASKLSLPFSKTILDKRYACFSHFESPKVVSKEAQIISICGGYIFYLPINEHRFSLGCVVAIDSEAKNPDYNDLFFNALKEATATRELIKETKQVLPIIPIQNIQKVCKKPLGKRYRIIGDAVAFMDPFFSSGIDFAFLSAEMGIFSILEDDEEMYASFLKKWIIDSKKSAFEKIEKSDWNETLKLFADPHLPYLIPIGLTQAFSQTQNKKIKFHEGIALARGVYGSKIC